MFICISVGMTGTASYYIAARDIEERTLLLRQDNLIRSAQALDDKLRSIIVSVMTLMISDPFLMMLRDTAAGNTGQFNQYFSRLQTPFTQMQLNEPAISSILVSSPLGEFYPTHNYRTAYLFEQSDMYKRIVDEKVAFWEKGHNDPFFRNRERVISFVMEPVSSFNVSGVYVVVNVSVQALQQQINTTFNLDIGEVLLLSNREGHILAVDETYRDVIDDPMFMNHIYEFDHGYFEYKLNRQQVLINYAQLNGIVDWVLVDLHPKVQLLQQINWIKWATVIIMIISIVIASTC